jgi:type II secretory pathway pseudopilin PulG
MKIQPTQPSRAGFTLMETVIAIGVIALLITGFVAVFTPAVDGIRRAITTEEADRLTTTLERELVTLRTGQLPAATTGFDKAFQAIRTSDQANERLLVYQYRGQLNSTRDDGTPTPVIAASGVSGRDFVTVPMMRRLSDPLLVDDFKALEGRVFVIRCTQLVYDENGALQRGTAGSIRAPRPGGAVAATSNDYTEAVLPFAAEFFSVPNRDLDFIRSYSFANRKPMFTRNLAVRR